MEYIIRSAKLADLHSCETLLDSPEFITADGEKWTARWLSNYVDDNFFQVAECNNKIIGCIVGEKLKYNGAVVWLLGIDSNMRGRGIGSNLLKKFEIRAKKIGCEWIIIYADLHNEKTLEFYKKNLYCDGSKYVECLKRL
jgi:ribosomal protein S18 acetylase RimI-like enzyme